MTIDIAALSYAAHRNFDVPSAPAVHTRRCGTCLPQFADCGCCPCNLRAACAALDIEVNTGRCNCCLMSDAAIDRHGVCLCDEGICRRCNDD